MPFHLPPFPFAKLLVQSFPLLDGRAAREGFNPLDVTQKFGSWRKDTRPHTGRSRTDSTSLIVTVSVTYCCTCGKVAVIPENIVVKSATISEDQSLAV